MGVNDSHLKGHPMTVGTFGHCEACGRFGYWSSKNRAFRCNLHWADAPVNGMDSLPLLIEKLQEQAAKMGERIRELEMGVQVIVVPDDDAEATNIPPGILAMLWPNDVLMSNDSLRMYVRHTQWENMKHGSKVTGQ